MPYFSLCDLTALPLSSFARRTTGCSISPAVVLDLPQQKRKEKNLEKKKSEGNKKKCLCQLQHPVACISPFFDVCLQAGQLTGSISTERRLFALIKD